MGAESGKGWVLPGMILRRRDIERRPWLPVAVAAVLLAPSLAVQASLRPAVRTAASPVQEEERPSEEERAGVLTASLPSAPGRSPRERTCRLVRVARPRAHRLARQVGTGPAWGDRGDLGLRLSVPPPYHNWVRSQTW